MFVENAVSGPVTHPPPLPPPACLETLEQQQLTMHIKTIIVDGFKSYATRTEIAGFDPEFNAITGLNGSGKSNILDAICFVLGISNLTQVWHPPFTASARATHARKPECAWRRKAFAVPSGG